MLISFSTSEMYKSTLQNKIFLNFLQQNIRRVSSKSLPRLPIPPIEQTIEKYLKTAKPFLNEKEFDVTRSIAERFAKSYAPTLQKFIVEKAEKCENWLADWWLNAAYLDFRSPVVVFSSPGLVFPFTKFNNEGEMLQFAANMIAGAIDYKLLIDNEKIPQEYMGKDLLDMGQYNKVFGTCRIPNLPRDDLQFHPNSKHIIIARNNNLFKVNVFGDDGKPLSIKQLVGQLKEVVKQSVNKGEGVGVLTSDHRDIWGRNYKQLISNPINAASVKEIQKSLFLLCLDKQLEGSSNRPPQTVASEQLIHGGGSKNNAGNRWYDKTIQFIVSPDGINGLTYEHAPAEGQPIAVMTDYVVNFIKQKKGDNIPDSTKYVAAEKLQFQFDDGIRNAIENSGKNIDKLVDDLEMDSFTFKTFGKNFIKSHKLSPDSFIQIALQYAFYRIHTTPGAHYESAATRKYIHGRTETIRSCSIESVNFAKTMLDENASNDAKVNALKAAIDCHKKYTIEAINGFGVDRHLLGIKLMAIEKKMEIHPFYSDPGYVRSAHMRISTSQVATKCDGFMCYGPLVSDGYACCYNPRDNDMNFACAAHISNPDTSASKFRKALEQSLLDMHDILMRATKSKL